MVLFSLHILFRDALLIDENSKTKEESLMSRVQPKFAPVYVRNNRVVFPSMARFHFLSSSVELTPKECDSKVVNSTAVSGEFSMQNCSIECEINNSIFSFPLWSAMPLNTVTNDLNLKTMDLKFFSCET